MVLAIAVAVLVPVAVVCGAKVLGAPAWVVAMLDAVLVLGVALCVVFVVGMIRNRLRRSE